MKSLFCAALMATSTLIGTAAYAEDNPWMIRGRVLGVLPDESGELSVAGAALPGNVDIGDQYVPELDISYFFNKNVAVELILAVTPHDVEAVNVTVPGALTNATVDLGDVWLLPPTLTLQYHFAPDAVINPYLGAGVNYTIFFNEDLPAGSPLLSIDHGDSFGPALQAGVDIKLNDPWFLNLDVKKVFMNTKATMDAGALGIVKASVDLDPWLFGVGFGRRF